MSAATLAHHQARLEDHEARLEVHGELLAQVRARQKVEEHRGRLTLAAAGAAGGGAAGALMVLLEWLAVLGGLPPGLGP